MSELVAVFPVVCALSILYSICNDASTMVGREKELAVSAVRYAVPYAYLTVRYAVPWQFPRTACIPRFGSDPGSDQRCRRERCLRALVYGIF